jgi:crotonobetainyl-CoA:carnitine CoA-transferase CaiB-like acyl-CoA transferase
LVSGGDRDSERLRGSDRDDRRKSLTLPAGVTFPLVTGPLSGIRVLDFSRVLAGPHCTRMLSDMGADVIKLEPPDGDLTRYASPRINGLSAYFVQQNSGKRNISIDLSTPQGSEIAVALAGTADVLVENYRAGVMQRLGLGVEALTSKYPRLIYASISGYGATGPWVERRAYASVVGAESGLTKLQGDARGGEYANDPLSHADTYTALELTTAVLAALYQREQTASRPDAGSRSTCRWPRPCCSSTTTSTASCGTAPRTPPRSATSGPATTSCSAPPTTRP